MYQLGEVVQWHAGESPFWGPIGFCLWWVFLKKIVLFVVVLLSRP